LWDTAKLGDDCFWLSEEELIANQSFQRSPIPGNVANHFQKRQHLFQREKVLMYGLFFFTGQISSTLAASKKRSICTPFLMYPAQIEIDEGDTYVNLRSQNPHINTRILSEFISEGNRDLAFANMPNFDSAIDSLLLLELVAWIQRYTLLEGEISILRYPKLSTHLNEEIGPELLITSSAALMLIDRPKGASGILHELKIISESEKFSSPINQLFSADNESANNIEKRTDFSAIPGLLSQAQKKAIGIAANETIGLISGPPGTGKSYTIAAMAADRVANNESVLIVCETEQAIDVIEEKLNKTFSLDNCHVRSGEKSFLKQFKSRVENWLNYGVKPVQDTEMKESLENLHDLQFRASKLEKKFIARCNRSIGYGGNLVKVKNNSASIFHKLIVFFANFYISRSTAHWLIIDQLQETLSERESRAAHHMRLSLRYRLNELLTNHRSELVKFNKAIRARTSGKQSNIFKAIDHEKLLRAFPVWLVTANTLHKILPLDRELFDLVLIDEATQCNVASAIPALYRAKRAVVVGDMKQLKHVSFLSKSKEDQLRKKHKISNDSRQLDSYRDSSILHVCSDMVTSQGCVTMLDEHFRSKPDIIAFSNYKFYQGRLKVMQHRPSEQLSNNVVQHYTLGVRDKRGVNKIEAEALITRLKETVSMFKAAKIPPTLGVISPFRDQSEYLRRLVSRDFTSDIISRHSLKVDTPYGFQGEERDIIFLSFGVDGDSLRAASYLRREDMFNVAVTRARQEQHVFHSLLPNVLPSGHLFRSYLEYSGKPPDTDSFDSDPVDDFQKEVSGILNAKGVSTWTHYPIAGRRVDILCQKNDKLLAIDLIGFPGLSRDFFELETYKLFLRANLEVFPLSYGLWCEKKQECIDEIVRRLDIV